MNDDWRKEGLQCPYIAFVFKQRILESPEKNFSEMVNEFAQLAYIEDKKIARNILIDALKKGIFPTCNIFVIIGTMLGFNEYEKIGIVWQNMLHEIIIL